MINSGTVYVGKNINIFDLLDEDDEEKINKLIEEEKLQKYKTNEFTSSFIKDVKSDHDSLLKIQELWKDINEDPKLDKLIFVGYTATKKIGASVQRNKAKRIMRELARKVITKYGTKNIYYVLIAKQSILKTSFKELETELKRLIS